MELFIPPELKHDELRIKRFFDAMLFKLRKNAHKNKTDKITVAEAMHLLLGEVDELRQAIEENNSMEIVLEGADVANFALLASIAATERWSGPDGEPEDMCNLGDETLQFDKFEFSIPADLGPDSLPAIEKVWADEFKPFSAEWWKAVLARKVRP